MAGPSKLGVVLGLGSGDVEEDEESAGEAAQEMYRAAAREMLRAIEQKDAEGLANALRAAVEAHDEEEADEIEE